MMGGMGRTYDGGLPTAATPVTCRPGAPGLPRRRGGRHRPGPTRPRVPVRPDSPSSRRHGGQPGHRQTDRSDLTGPAPAFAGRESASAPPGSPATVVSPGLTGRAAGRHDGEAVRDRPRRPTPRAAAAGDAPPAHPPRRGPAPGPALAAAHAG